jgi:hypothetical protein
MGQALRENAKIFSSVGLTFADDMYIMKHQRKRERK